MGEKIYVVSSHGTFTVDAKTGNVESLEKICSCKKGECSIPDIVKFDLPEYCSFWGRVPEKLSGTVDILNLGFWTKSGEYFHPDEDFREDIIREINDRQEKKEGEKDEADCN